MDVEEIGGKEERCGIDIHWRSVKKQTDTGIVSGCRRGSYREEV
jgi:hypothetical protein